MNNENRSKVIQDVLFKVVAIDKAGGVYETFIETLEQAIMAAAVADDAYDRLDEIKLRLMSGLATVENIQANAWLQNRGVRS